MIVHFDVAGFVFHHLLKPPASEESPVHAQGDAYNLETHVCPGSSPYTSNIY